MTLGGPLFNFSNMNAVSYSEARANVNAMIDKVVADRAPLAITRHRGEGAVLVSASEWDEAQQILFEVVYHGSAISNTKLK